MAEAAILAQQAARGGGTLAALALTGFARFPDREAVADDRTRWTYRQLAAAVARLAARFDALGLQHGEGVALLSPNRVEAVAAMLAALVRGLRYTALHPLGSTDDHAHVVQHAQVSLLIVDAEAFGERGRTLAAAAGVSLMAFGSLEGAADASRGLAAEGPPPLEARAEPEDIAYLSYTGGTTGRPKGVMLSHRAMVAVALAQAADWDWPEPLRFLAATPISHAAGAVLHPILLRGGFVRLATGFEPQAFRAVAHAESATATLLVPTMIYRLLDDLRARPEPAPSLRMIAYGAAPMNPDRLREALAAFGPVFVQFYGQTEAPQVICTLRTIDHDLSRPERLSSCGLPGPACEVRLLDGDGNSAAREEAGEVVVRGPIVMSGYWRDPEATATALRSGWLHTGDVARRDANGFLTLVDRVKDMIITGGFNVYPREVEDALLSHCDVAAAAAVGVPDATWGEAVKAFVVLRPNATVDAAELRAHVRARRGPIAAPKSVAFVEGLPLTALGKVDRKALRAPEWAGQARGVS